MVGGSREPWEGAEELGTDEKDTGMGGRHTKGLGGFFQGDVAGSTPIQDGDVGGDPPHGHDIGGGVGK